MAQPYDPLACIPAPDAVRHKLAETELLAERLRILLDVAERLRLPLTTADRLATPADARQGA